MVAGTRYVLIKRSKLSYNLFTASFLLVISIVFEFVHPLGGKEYSEDKFEKYIAIYSCVICIFHNFLIFIKDLVTGAKKM